MSFDIVKYIQDESKEMWLDKKDNQKLHAKNIIQACEMLLKITAGENCK